MELGPKLDRIDLKILTRLQQFGRITNVELADAVGLSPSPCLTRVKRLEKAGYVSGYGAHINMRKLGEYLTVFTEVTLSEHRQGDFSRFESRIFKIDEIIECHTVSGGYDYMLKFVARGVAHFRPDETLSRTRQSFVQSRFWMTGKGGSGFPTSERGRQGHWPRRWR